MSCAGKVIQGTASDTWVVSRIHLARFDDVLPEGNESVNSEEKALQEDALKFLSCISTKVLVQINQRLTVILNGLLTLPNDQDLEHVDAIGTGQTRCLKNLLVSLLS